MVSIAGAEAEAEAVRSRVLRYEKLNQGLEALGLFQNILCTIASTLERLAAVRTLCCGLTQCHVTADLRSCGWPPA